MINDSSIQLHGLVIHTCRDSAFLEIEIPNLSSEKDIK